MSRNVLSILWLVAFFFHRVFCYGIGEFPITNTVQHERVDGAILTHHQTLREATIKSVKNQESTNCFKCGFRLKIGVPPETDYWTDLYDIDEIFKSGAGQISKIHQITLAGIHGKFYEIVRQEVDTHNITGAQLIASIFNIVETRSGKEDGASKKVFKMLETPKNDNPKATDSKVMRTIRTLAHSKDATSEIVVTRDQAKALHNFIETRNKQQSKLITDLRGQLERIIQEYDKTTRTGSQRYYALINSDSEAKAIVFLSDENNLSSLIAKVKPEIKDGGEILAIEFHGYTTQDMCPLCYTNFNIIQYIANKLNYEESEENIGFLASLKRLLISEGLADKSCKTAIVISSSEEFPGPEVGGNLLWHELSTPHNIVEYDRVNQFRFQDGKEKEEPKQDKKEQDSSSGVPQKDLHKDKQPQATTDPAIAWFSAFSQELHFERGASTVTYKTASSLPNIFPQKALSGYEYKLIDVPGDGNCGIWATLACLHPEWQNQIFYIHYDEMIKLRALATASAIDLHKKHDDNLGKYSSMAARLITPYKWISSLDYLGIAHAINRDIIIITNITEQKSVEFFKKDGTSEPIFNWAQGDAEFNMLKGKQVITESIRRNNDAIIIYQTFNHYQAIVKFPIWHILNPYSWPIWDKIWGKFW
jgi:hypothetical protein